MKSKWKVVLWILLMANWDHVLVDSHKVSIPLMSTKSLRCHIPRLREKLSFRPLSFVVSLVVQFDFARIFYIEIHIWEIEWVTKWQKAVIIFYFEQYSCDQKTRCSQLLPSCFVNSPTVSSGRLQQHCHISSVFGVHYILVVSEWGVVGCRNGQLAIGLGVITCNYVPLLLFNLGRVNHVAWRKIIFIQINAHTRVKDRALLM